MWTILGRSVFLDPLLAFTYRRNDGHFRFNAISVYKVCYIDFVIWWLLYWYKILGKLFVNDKQILIECFKSFLTLYPTNTPRGFHVETTWKRRFPRRFNEESKWCVCRVRSGGNRSSYMPKAAGLFKYVWPSVTTRR